MSITSITIRLDIGDDNSSAMSGAVSLQGGVPSPIGFRSDASSISQSDAPTPSASIALSSDQEMPPTPMSGTGSLGVSVSEPPVPSHDIEGAASTASGKDDLPKPAGHPAGAKEASAKR